MKRLITLAAVVAFTVVWAMPAASADIGAVKETMYQGESWTCAAGATPSAIAVGSVTLRLTPDGVLEGTLKLKDAVPDATYTVWIAGTNIQGQTCEATPFLGHLSTDDKGKGSFDFSIAGVADQDAVWVIAEDGGPRLQSPAVSLTIPG